MVLARPAIAATGWPDLASPAPAVGGGSRDAAVIVGIEDYAFVPDIPGARANVLAWFDYLTRTRKVPIGNIAFLQDNDGTVESMTSEAKRAAARVGKGGTLWFVFVGHGTPSRDGKDRLLVAVDAQQRTKNLLARSLSQNKLLGYLKKSRASRINVVLDACFSGRTTTGAPLVPGVQPLVLTTMVAPRDPRVSIFAASRGDQFAGSLPNGNRPAFSYLMLGGLRGWADENGDKKITAGELLAYVKGTLRATLKGRDQTPTLSGGKRSRTVAASPGEKGPDLIALVRAMAVGSFPKAPPGATPPPAAPPVKMKSKTQRPSGAAFNKALFPIHGVTLGVTTKGDLKRLGKRKRREPGHYTIKKMEFWVEKDGVVSGLSIGKRMPKKWQKLGLRKGMDVGEFKKVMRRIDSKIEVEVGDPYYGTQFMVNFYWQDASGIAQFSNSGLFSFILSWIQPDDWIPPKKPKPKKATAW